MPLRIDVIFNCYCTLSPVCSTYTFLITGTFYGMSFSEEGDQAASIVWLKTLNVDCDNSVVAIGGHQVRHIINILGIICAERMIFRKGF